MEVTHLDEEGRARMVDVAGNVIDPGAPGALLPAVKTASIYYSRWEPIIAPSITLRHSIKGSPGESTAYDRESHDVRPPETWR